MGLRFRKSVKLAPGIKLNMSKSGISTTVGGHGISYRTQLVGGKSKKSKKNSDSSVGKVILYILLSPFILIWLSYKYLIWMPIKYTIKGCIWCYKKITHKNTDVNDNNETETESVIEDNNENV